MNASGAACWIAALMFAGAATQAQPLPAGAAACLDRLEAAESGLPADTDSAALPRITDACPDYLAALESSVWGTELAAVEPGELNRAGLEALAAIAGRYQSVDRAAIPVDRLKALVAELEPFTPQEPKSLWDRLGEWIESWFRSESGDPTTLARWLASISIPAEWVEVIIYGLAVLLGLAVLAVLINELRASGAFLRRRNAAPGALSGAAGHTDGTVPTFEAIRNTNEMGTRIEMLFAIVVDRLRRLHPALLSSALTHRELARSIPDLEASARGLLREVTDAAERVTYSRWRPDAAGFEQIYESGQSLVVQLEERPGTAS